MVHLTSVGLAAEEGGDVELVLLAGIMHRRVAAMGIEAMRGRPPRVFRYRVRGPAFRVAGRRALLGTLELRHWARCARHRCCCRSLRFCPASKPH